MESRTLQSGKDGRDTRPSGYRGKVSRIGQTKIGLIEPQYADIAKFSTPTLRLAYMRDVGCVVPTHLPFGKTAFFVGWP